MPRRYRPARRVVDPDIRYNSEMVSFFINKVMRAGKKSTARGLVYDAFDVISNRTGKDPLETFEQAIRNAAPMIEVKPRRVGGAHVPGAGGSCSVSPHVARSSLGVGRCAHPAGQDLCREAGQRVDRCLPEHGFRHPAPVRRRIVWPRRTRAFRSLSLVGGRCPGGSRCGGSIRELVADLLGLGKVRRWRSGG